uniref:Rho guanine nucleotide exchange factor 7 n=1 Tax=Photinus pyralis TaxID=7054 RepID=A0A1Y1N5D1_PHOPY
MNGINTNMASEPLIVQAIYSFKGTNNDELCFKKGDQITITQKEEGGWWEGTLGDKTGWFPSNYVKECKDFQTANAASTSSQQKQYRAVVLKDLIDSENAHISEQQGVVHNFLQPLEKSSVLSADEYRQLTGNFLEVLETHQQLLALIEEEAAKPSEDQRVGRLFLNWAPRIKLAHQAYCSLHPKAAFILDKYRDELTTYMESCGATTPGVLVLTIGLSKPFRRLDKYSGMLQELERHLEESHVDRGDTQRSVAVYKDIAATCLAIRRQKELELQVVTGPVRGWEGQSLSSLGDIVYMGSVAVGPQHHDRYLVLFPSTLLILSVSPRFSAFIYEGKLPLTGITVTRLEDSDQYKNAFEITGPLIEKRTAICQSKDEANHWVELLRKHMPHRINGSSPKVSPSQAELVPQPPPHLDPRGYCNRTSVVFFTYNPSVPYNPTLPSLSYPSAAPYANLSKHYRKLIKERKITRRLMKKLLYPEYLNKKFDTSAVKKRRHKTECVIIPKDSYRRMSVINCDSDSSSYSISSTSNSDSSDDDKPDIFYRIISSSHDRRSSSSSNPFGYIRYYNPQTGEQREESKYESFIDYGEVNAEQPPSKGSVLLTSSVNVQLRHQTSETSEESSSLEAKPYMACENLLNLDNDMAIETNIKKMSVPKIRQTMPPKFVANKFSENSLTSIYIPPWKSKHDKSICRSTVSAEPTKSESASTTTHSSSLDLNVNPVPLPDKVLAELLYNFDTNSVVCSDSVIKPPTMYRNTQGDQEMHQPKPKRRSSIQFNPSSDKTQSFGLRRCVSYQLVKLADPSTSTYMPCCRCMETSHGSSRSSDSGMAGSCNLNSPDFAMNDPQNEKRPGCDCVNRFDICDGDLSSLGSNVVSFSENEAEKFESQCQCTSPFGSTPRTSCQTYISENIATGTQGALRTSLVDISHVPTPHPWESVNLIHSKLMQIRSQNETLKKQRCPASVDTDSMSKSVACISDEPKVSSLKEKTTVKPEIYKSGLYAHWWLKAKIPNEVVRGIYEDARSPTTDVSSSGSTRTVKRKQPPRDRN